MKVGKVFAIVLAIALPWEVIADSGMKEGARIYNKCRGCHTLAPGKNRIGPSLSGLFGRQPGTSLKFRFSTGMREFGIDKVWTRELFLIYIEKPRQVVKGTAMAFPGIKAKRDRENLTNYLLRATK